MARLTKGFKIILAAMLISLYVNRRKNYSILSREPDHPPRGYSPGRSARSSTDDTLVDPDEYADDSESDDSVLLQPVEAHPKRHSSLPPAWAGGRFRNNIHSRILQKFPFLIEMFYWTLNYIAYRMSKIGAAAFHGRKGDAVVQLAQDHGVAILEWEHHSIFSFFFAIKEIDVQQFFLKDHINLMSVLNQFYSLVHIPGTVAFISWYYYAAPSFNEFAVARRTMTLGNFVAFFVFAVWPCMPPRLLPESFGFEDTVRQSHAESVWTGADGKSGSFNQLAAMPSLHFTYALVIGCTFFWHSGFIQSLRGKPRERSVFGMVGFMLAGILYPMFVVLVIVATANHYYLDAVAATFAAIFSYLCNRIWLLLLPVERLLARILRVEKPVPTTGESRRGRVNGRNEVDGGNKV